MRTSIISRFVLLAALGVSATAGLGAQTAQAPPTAPPAAQPGGVPAPPPIDLPSGYVIGPEDVLVVQFWKDTDVSAQVTVRPDGKISLQAINEIVAAGLTPEELRQRIITAAKPLFKEDPVVNVMVKEIHSRKVSIQGAVIKIGAYPLLTSMRVADLIAQAGGLQEFAKLDKIILIRIENGKQTVIPINYKDIQKGRNLDKYNIELKPGDTIIVP